MASTTKVNCDGDQTPVLVLLASSYCQRSQDHVDQSLDHHHHQSQTGGPMAPPHHHDLQLQLQKWYHQQAVQLQQMQVEIEQICGCASVVAKQRKHLQLESLLAVRLRLVDWDLHSTEQAEVEQHVQFQLMSPYLNLNQDPHQDQTLLDDSPLPNLMLDQCLPTQWDLNQAFCSAIGCV